MVGVGVPILVRDFAVPFTTALKAKLRIGLYHPSDAPTCPCGQRVDIHGDHFFTCGEYKKTRCSNDMRDATWRVMQRICPTAQYCRSKEDVHHEKLGLVASAPGKRPFDWSFSINHFTAARIRGSSHLSEIGVDVTVVGPTSPSDLLRNASIQDNSISLLQDGEKGKFAREKTASCKRTMRTLTGDEFIGDLYNNNRALIPQAMDRWGQMGPLFQRFLLGDRDAPDPMEYVAARPYARKMNERACSNAVPYGILNTANKNWIESNPSSWFGDSYMDADPKSWALGQLGLGFTTAIVDHISRADARATNPNAKSYYDKRKSAAPAAAPTPTPLLAPHYYCLTPPFTRAATKMSDSAVPSWVQTSCLKQCCGCCFGPKHNDDDSSGDEIEDKSASGLSHVGKAAYDTLRRHHNHLHHILWNVSSGRVVGDVHQTPKTNWSSRSDPPKGADDWFPAKIGEIVGRTEFFCDVMSLGPPDGLFLVEMKKGLARIAERAGTDGNNNEKKPVIVRMMFGNIVGMPVNCAAVMKALTEDLPEDANMRIWVGAWRHGVSWNHAKIVAVDGQYLHTGGHNMWDEHYLKSNPVHDLSLEIEGRVAKDGHAPTSGGCSWR
ncbi:hypothetical protein ACHAXT_009256 [Thalassiosira profunda]